MRFPVRKLARTKGALEKPGPIEIRIDELAVEGLGPLSPSQVSQSLSESLHETLREQLNSARRTGRPIEPEIRVSAAAKSN